MEDKDLLLDDEMDEELGNLGEGLITNPNGEPGNLDGDWNNMNDQQDQFSRDDQDVDDLDENV